jgi:DNA repair exonuclease SbcCD nuclease subunit
MGWLTREHRQDRRRDQQRALEKAIEQAIARDVSAILIPGDLFDRAGVDTEMLAFAVLAFEITGCPPVYITPGNHDPMAPTSLVWSERLLRTRGFRWPANVEIFDSPSWTARPLLGQPVLIWGRCFQSGTAVDERPLSEASIAAIGPLDPAYLHVGLFHGSLEGHCPPHQKMVGPFSEDDALRAPFAYLAVGHYHRRCTSRPMSVVDASAAIDGNGDGTHTAPPSATRWGYAGSAVALDCTETGLHGALEVRIEWEANEQRHPEVKSSEVEVVPLDTRRVHELTVDVSGCASADQVDRRVLHALDSAAVSERDLTRVHLAGRLVRGVRYGGPGVELKERAFHLALDLGGLKPDYDLESYRIAADETTEGRFARALLERLEHESDPRRRATLERALYYGLDAFRLGEVQPAYEELAE